MASDGAAWCDECGEGGHEKRKSEESALQRRRAKEQRNALLPVCAKTGHEERKRRD